MNVCTYATVVSKIKLCSVHTYYTRTSTYNVRVERELKSGSVVFVVVVVVVVVVRSERDNLNDG